MAGLAFLILTMLPAPASPDPGLLLEGATVYVAAGSRPARSAILLRDGKIVFVGDAGSARRKAPRAARVDLAGSFVFPGWADAHGHLAGLGRALEVADLRGAGSAEEAAKRIAAVAGALPAGSWAEGRGWDQNRWPGSRFPDARDLDAVVPDRPAIAQRVDGHAVWLNTAALKAARIDAATPDPSGGRIVRRPDGSASGVLVDRAMGLVEDVEPPGTTADFKRRILAASKACAKAGLTQVQDASHYGPDEIATLAKLADSSALPIRVYATVANEAASLAGFFAKGLRVGRGRDFLTVRAIKVLADGALGSRGAALLADYADDPGNRGLLVTPPERLDELALEARKHGWQLWIHAIGDRGNRLALDAFARAAAAAPDAPAGGRRPRIEHAQVLDPADIPRFAREGVIASVQPTHATSDMPWAEARVGPGRIGGAYAWRQLKNAGARLAGGSDFPVESENPLLGFYSAVTRQDLEGKPAGGWRPKERLTREEALALFTSDAAYAAFEEDRRGRIEPGFEADLTVFARDPMAVAVEEIPRIPVVLTLVGGRVAYGQALTGGKTP
jgi:predicted amidohydrolase YtcJ